MNITEAERDAVYKTIFSRRDVRREFKSDPIPQAVLERILLAAHHAPSVGFMQPWDFITIQSPITKSAIKKGFLQAHHESLEQFEGDRQNQYKRLKLEGIEEAPLGICVTCDRSRTGPVVLGRTTKPEMDLFSAVCAVQNLWLAARAENIGVGWVSIIHDNVVRNALKIPENIDIIAYLCVGYVDSFHSTPDLERAGWLPRRDVKSAIHHEYWQEPSFD
ncbi:5,6-dimethylbenzimidazole synthase [Marinomonas sp. M1K-6]|uniref:5,6-dimethylbenzimidazole synthase n=1 Tax=Marinomonas profundi TaxID=2726122 RepID=A0A847QV43_9GAMM|nr:5,6-dimethylbenzimidazole synthase [Marinomonas profundi]NLQ16608.1 5,6-dimethylbenzimidazole synthase [Marinomonas profundi]UDV03807.1 5,6-dimethylbenzimidazole synthase [Marinomonas profundi]